MCWSKRGSPDVSTVVTTTFTPEGSSALNDTSEYCQYPAVECHQDLNDGYCSGNGKCCELEDTARYCVCFTGYTEKYCQTQKTDPFFLESLEANTTIGIAVGVVSFVVLVLTALLVSFVIMRLKKKKNERQNPADTPLTQVDLHNNSDDVHRTRSEELESLASDSNHNNTKPISE